MVLKVLANTTAIKAFAASLRSSLSRSSCPKCLSVVLVRDVHEAELSMTQRIALFPGSFDPLTRGHIDLVRRALRIFDRVVVGVLVNSTKDSLFSPEEREVFIRTEFSDSSDRVVVKSFSGLLVEFAKQVQAQVVIRGLRAISDYDYEAQMALMNKHLYEELETFFMIAREENSYVSSSLVRQIAALGGEVEKLVTPVVASALKQKLLAKKNSS